MSDSTKINCPNCDQEIDVQDYMSHQLDEEYRKKYQDELAKQKNSFEEKEAGLKKQKIAFEENKQKANEMFAERLDSKLKEEKSKLEVKLKAEREELDETLRKEKIALKKSLSEKLEEEQSDRFKILQGELNEKSEKLKELNKSKAEIEKLKREKSELKESIEAEAQKEITLKLEEEKEKIRKVEKEKNELALLELKKQLDDQKKLTEEMQRKQEQGSMQLQGEIQELALEDLLRSIFPYDLVDEVSKGVRGADTVQTVVNPLQQVCGKIIYESKRTKSFSDQWLDKLKNDSRVAGADLAVLVTETMPNGMEAFGRRNGVWICSYQEVKGLAFVLREMILKLQSVRSAEENKGDKMEVLYGYLTSEEFKQRIEAIVDGFSSMKDNLIKEKRAMEKIWKMREKEIEKVTSNTIDMYGSIKGIAGNAIGTVEALELPGMEDE